MVVHCLELITSTDYPAQQARDDLATFRENHSEVLKPQATDYSRRGAAATEAFETEHYHARFRFAWSESLSDLRSAAESWLSSNFSWWAWRYHECDHDEGSQLGCNWDAQNTSGDVPQDVIDYYT